MKLTNSETDKAQLILFKLSKRKVGADRIRELAAELAKLLDDEANPPSQTEETPPLLTQMQGEERHWPEKTNAKK